MRIAVVAVVVVVSSQKNKQRINCKSLENCCRLLLFDLSFKNHLNKPQWRQEKIYLQVKKCALYFLQLKPWYFTMYPLRGFIRKVYYLRQGPISDPVRSGLWPQLFAIILLRFSPKQSSIFVLTSNLARFCWQGDHILFFDTI